MEKRTFLDNDPEKLQPNYEALTLAIQFTSSFLKTRYNSWGVHVQWHISVARHTGLLTGAAREHAPVHLSTGFPTNILHSSWEGFSYLNSHRLVTTGSPK